MNFPVPLNVSYHCQTVKLPLGTRAESLRTLLKGVFSSNPSNGPKESLIKFPVNKKKSVCGTDFRLSLYMILLERSTSIVFSVDSLWSLKKKVKCSQLILWVCHVNFFQNTVNMISWRQSKFNILSFKPLMIRTLLNIGILRSTASLTPRDNRKF